MGFGLVVLHNPSCSKLTPIGYSLCLHSTTISREKSLILVYERRISEKLLLHKLLVLSVVIIRMMQLASAYYKGIGRSLYHSKYFIHDSVNYSGS